jgi:hypothetical protein
MNSDDIKRLNFYEKQFLRTRDFQDEQAYHIEMRRRHLIAHHTWGIIVGLEIKQDPNSKVWSVQPGMAVDGFGREIVVFAPEPLDMNQIMAQLAGASLPAFLKVWIAYHVEKSNPPAPGYEVCDQQDQYTRIRETFRLIYQDDPPTRDQTKPPQPCEDLADDPEIAPWPVYLGTIQWDKDPQNQSQRVITQVLLLDPRDDKTRRRYVGNITAEMLAPAGELLIRDRNAPHPLPTNPNDPHYGGVATKVEGSLEIDRLLKANQDLHVMGKVGIGTTTPEEKLHVDAGSIFVKGEGQGVIVDAVSEKGVGLMKYPGREAGIWRISGKDFEIGRVDGTDIKSLGANPIVDVYVSGNGNVGIGTTSPGAKLEIGSSGNLLLKASADDPGDIIFQSSGGVQKARIWSDPSPGLNKLHLSSADNIPDITIDQNGNVGIGTTTPTQRLHVDLGDILVEGVNSFDAGGEEARVFLGDTNHYIKSIHGSGVRIGTYGVGDVITVLQGSGNVGIGKTNAQEKLDVNGRILRRGQAFSITGNASNGNRVTVPWGNTDDWNIFVSPREMGLEEPNSEADNALLNLNDAKNYR